MYYKNLHIVNLYNLQNACYRRKICLTPCFTYLLRLFAFTSEEFSLIRMMKCVIGRLLSFKAFRSFFLRFIFLPPMQKCRHDQLICLWAIFGLQARRKKKKIKKRNEDQPRQDFIDDAAKPSKV